MSDPTSKPNRSSERLTRLMNCSKTLWMQGHKLYAPIPDVHNTTPQLPPTGPTGNDDYDAGYAAGHRNATECLSFADMDAMVECRPVVHRTNVVWLCGFVDAVYDVWVVCNCPGAYVVAVNPK